jgi:hypothetical protein
VYWPFDSSLHRLATSWIVPPGWVATNQFKVTGPPVDEPPQPARITPAHTNAAAPIHRFLHRELPITHSPLVCASPYPGQIASKLAALDLVSRYLSTVAERLQDVLGRDLVGVYVGGSYALGDYLPERSDLDVAVVVRSTLSRALKHRIVAEVREDAIHCPARKLELVVYGLETTRSATPTPDFELNVNTGAEMPLHVDYGRADREVGGHWFAIDHSVLAQAGVALRGPPAREVFAAIAPTALTPVLVESLRWHRDRGADPSDAVLNACRALRFTIEGCWSSKPPAGEWSVERGLAPADLVASARVARAQPAGIDPGRVSQLLEAVEARLRGQGRALK